MVSPFRREIRVESVMLAHIPGKAFGVLKPLAGECRRDPIAKVADDDALARRRSTVDDDFSRCFSRRRDRLRAGDGRSLEAAAFGRNGAREATRIDNVAVYFNSVASLSMQ